LDSEKRFEARSYAREKTQFDEKDRPAEGHSTPRIRAELRSHGSAGENVYGAEVEHAIYEHPAVHEAAV